MLLYVPQSVTIVFQMWKISRLKFQIKKTNKQTLSLDNSAHVLRFDPGAVAVMFFDALMFSYRINFNFESF